MSRQLLGTLVQSGLFAERTNRGLVLPASLVLHALAATGLVVAPLLSADVLPKVPAAPVSPLCPPLIAVGFAQQRDTAPRMSVRTPPAGAPTIPRVTPRKAAFLAPSTVPADLAPDDGLGSDDAAPLSPAGALGGLVGIPGGSLGERSSDGGGGGNPAAETRPRRVGGVIQAPTKVHHAAPEYPAIARRARVQGTVIIQCTISAEGRVVDVETLRGVPLLNRAATDAVRQWRFTPTRLDGKAIAVSMTVSVVFRLD